MVELCMRTVESGTLYNCEVIDNVVMIEHLEGEGETGVDGAMLGKISHTSVNNILQTFFFFLI